MYAVHTELDCLSLFCNHYSLNTAESRTVALLEQQAQNYADQVRISAPLLALGRSLTMCLVSNVSACDAAVSTAQAIEARDSG